MILEGELSKLEKWCHFCINASRARGIHGIVVLLTDVNHCESSTHETIPLVLANIERKRRPMKRGLDGRYVPKEERGIR